MAEDPAFHVSDHPRWFVRLAYEALNHPLLEIHADQQTTSSTLEVNGRSSLDRGAGFAYRRGRDRLALLRRTRLGGTRGAALGSAPLRRGGGAAGRYGCLPARDRVLTGRDQNARWRRRSQHVARPYRPQARPTRRATAPRRGGSHRARARSAMSVRRAGALPTVPVDHRGIPAR